MTIGRHGDHSVHPGLLSPNPRLYLHRGAHARLDEVAYRHLFSVHLDERFRCYAKTGRRGALSGGVDPAGSHLRHVAQYLAVVREYAVRYEDMRVGDLDVVNELLLAFHVLSFHDLVPAEPTVEAAEVAVRTFIGSYRQIVTFQDLVGRPLRHVIGVLHEQRMRRSDGQSSSTLGGEPYQPPGRVPLPDADCLTLFDAPAGGEGHHVKLSVSVLPIVHLLWFVDRKPVVHELLDVLLGAVAHEHLGVAGDALCDPGVSDQQNMNVPPDLGSVLQKLGGAAEELQRDALLDLVVTVDGRGDGAHDLAEDLGVLRLLLDQRLILVRDHHFFVLVLLELRGHDRQVDVE